FDKYSGRLLKTLPHARKSPGMKLNDMNYDVHVGQILGLTGKIIAFMASLICASLPITGFIIWWGKRKKSKKSKPREVTHRRLEKQLAK
ncbi:MAG: PepSY domain-containing protein, partial [Mucilaginibacter sp.]